MWSASTPDIIRRQSEREEHRLAVRPNMLENLHPSADMIDQPRWLQVDVATGIVRKVEHRDLASGICATLSFRHHERVWRVKVPVNQPRDLRG
jgi:hypothetical protein